MTSKTLQTIAEVKMHLRDSHAASWSQKQRSRNKRHFGIPPSSSTHTPDQSLPGTPNTTLSSIPPPIPPVGDTEMDNDNNLHPVGLREMIEDFNALEDEDGLDHERESTYVWGARSVCDLFDFSSNHWVKGHREKCSRGLAEELNFYELLSGHDIDAAGVEESHFCDYQ